MNYLDGLNNRQLDAVRATEGPVRVIAGAGTGKTRALTARYCYLADLMGIDTSSVLCLTFTNKAATEMKQRIRRQLGDVDTAFVCTFHSWCAQMLRQDIHYLSYPANFALLDEDDQKTLLQRVYADMGITLKQLPLRRAIDYIALRKENDGYVEHTIAELANRLPADDPALPAADRLPHIYARYLYEQKKQYALDYDDLIVFAHHILVNSPSVRDKWQQKMQYVMVDEFQDVSARQYAIARILSEKHRNIFIVGDPDQTIYTWRGARVDFILDFDKVYPDSVTIVLTDNYRSTPQILQAANALVSVNANRYPKALEARCGAGSKPVMYHARNDKDEARWIARSIKKFVGDSHSPSQIAILYRSHHLSRPIEDELLKMKMPYVIYSGTAFYARREVKDVLAYLRMTIRPDDMSFLRTVNTPSRRIGTRKLQAVADYAEKNGISRYEAFCAMADGPVLRNTGAKAYIDAIEACRAIKGTVPLSDLVQQMLQRSGYEQMLRELSEWERLDNLAELKRAIQESADASDDDNETSLETFLQRAALIANIDRDTSAETAVRLMTVHTAKGMEWDIVFVAGMNDGAFPSKRSEGPDEIEEERRLAYVALTRARKCLHISDSEGFAHDRSAKVPSRFIYEMGIDNLELLRPLPPSPQRPEPMAGAADGARFSAGARVEHPVFGTGTITAVDAAAHTYTITFDKLSTARTMRYGAPLDPAK